MTQAQIEARLAELRETLRELDRNYSADAAEVMQAIRDLDALRGAVANGEDAEQLRIGLRALEKCDAGDTNCLTDEEVRALPFVRLYTREELRAIVRGADELADMQQAVAV